MEGTFFLALFFALFSFSLPWSFSSNKRDSRSCIIWHYKGAYSSHSPSFIYILQKGDIASFSEIGDGISFGLFLAFQRDSKKNEGNKIFKTENKSKLQVRIEMAQRRYVDIKNFDFCPCPPTVSIGSRNCSDFTT